MGDYNGAVDWFEKAAAIAEKLAAADPSDLLAMSDVGTAWARVAESQTAAGDYRAALDAFRRSDPPLLRALARAPDNRLVAQTLAFSDLSRARAFAATGDLSGEVESLDRVLNLCHAGLKKDAASASWNHMAWLAQGQKAALIATKGNRGEALSQAQQLLEAVRHSPIVNEVSKHNYMARALDANGAVHAILAKQASGDGVLSEWREAAGYYQRAMEEWNLSPSHTTEPSLSDFRRTQAGLAAALRESRGPGAR